VPDKTPIIRAVSLRAALPIKPSIKVIRVPIMLCLLLAAALVKCCMGVSLGLIINGQFYWLSKIVSSNCEQLARSNYSTLSHRSPVARNVQLGVENSCEETFRSKHSIKTLASVNRGSRCDEGFVYLINSTTSTCLIELLFVLLGRCPLGWDERHRITNYSSIHYRYMFALLRCCCLWLCSRCSKV